MDENKFVNRNYLVFSLVFVVFSFFIMKSFLFGILWGVIIAISLWPTCDNLSQKKLPFIKPDTQKNAFIFTFLFSVIFLLPIFYAFGQLTGVYTLVSEYVKENTQSGVFQYPAWFVQLPFHEKIIANWNQYIATSQGLNELVSHVDANKLLSVFASFWGQVFERILTVTVMIITLFFMLKNGRIVQQNYSAVLDYWFSSKSTVSVKSGIQALRGTINGVILVGIVEGILLSIPLALGGINAGIIIGLLAGIAGVIPLLMPALIIPCLVYLFFTGQSMWAVVGAIDLLIVWFVFENVIKPQMISKTVKINTFIILVSMIGGMQTLGLVGLFLGPAIVAMGIGMMKEFFKTAFLHEQTESSVTVTITKPQSNNENQ